MSSNVGLYLSHSHQNKIRALSIQQERLDPISDLNNVSTRKPLTSSTGIRSPTQTPLNVSVNDRRWKAFTKSKREAARWIHSDGWLACWSTRVTTKPYVQADKGVFFFGTLCRWRCALAGTRNIVLFRRRPTNQNLGPAKTTK